MEVSDRIQAPGRFTSGVRAPTHWKNTVQGKNKLKLNIYYFKTFFTDRILIYSGLFM